MTRFEYERIFETYHDLLIIGQFCAMLGCIAESIARKLLQPGNLHPDCINPFYDLEIQMLIRIDGEQCMDQPLSISF